MINRKNILVSFCNNPFQTSSSLLCVQVAEDGERFFSYAPVSLGYPDVVTTATGLARGQDKIFVLFSAEQGFFVSVLNEKDLSPLFYQRVPDVRDGHSMLVIDNVLYIVSTGTDEVLSYEIMDNSLENVSVVWRLSETKADTQHINSIAEYDGEIFITAFGIKMGELKETARDGYIYSISSQRKVIETLYQPHSLSIKDGDFYCCNSRMNTIVGKQFKKPLFTYNGYTRGLHWLTDDVMAFGSSIGRKVSRSTGLVSNPADAGEKIGECAIVIGDVGNGKILSKIDLSHFASEIYDIVVLPDSDVNLLELSNASLLLEREVLQKKITELTDFKTRIAQKDNQLAERDARLAERNELITKLNEELVEHQNVITTKDVEIHSIKASKMWRASQVFSKLFNMLFPQDSLRARLFNKTISLIFLPLSLYRRVRDIRLIRNSTYFDAEWYQEQNPDIAHARIDPAKHYYKYGGFEGRDPSPAFSSNRYLNQYQDIALTAQNPLVHYLRQGQHEGREIHPSTQTKLFYPGIQLSVERESLPRFLYRNLYKYTGILFRRLFPQDWVDRIKQLFPTPDGIPKHLYHRPSIYQRYAPVSGEFTSPNVDAQPDIFIFSIINWNFRHQRPQHIAEGLAETRRRVFYIEQNMSQAGIEIDQISKNLYVVRLSAHYSGVIQPYSGRPNSHQTQQWIQAFYDLLETVNASSFKQIIIQHPFWWQLVRHLSPEFQVVYDCMDDIVEFSNTEPFIVSLEYNLLEKCDSLIVSSRHLYEKYEEYNHPTLIRNAADINHFLPENQIQNNIPLKFQRLEKSNRIKVGYVGAVSDWFDVELVKNAALLDKNIEFHICGGVTNKAAVALDDLENITLYGEISYQEVPLFLELIDIAIIPFQITPIIEACDPVKFYEYSAVGKPTVTTALPELKRASDLIFTASTPEEMVQQIHLAFEKSKSEEFIQAVQTYAKNNTWEHRVHDFVKVLDAFPKVSVVILSYGPPSLTQAALDSLYAFGATYPNLEVLIVDNGSSAENIAEIYEFSTQYPNVNVIENGENLGFAKGNNVGLRAASGQYVMLLNNDAEVAPGSIYSMVRHLQNNPKVGAVGPLTNNIGNEAKLFVEYKDSDEMRQVARKVTTGYRGMYTEISVLAYFAVMFRKEDLVEFGLLSEDYGYGMFEDDDHCAIIKSKGYICALAEDAFIHHQLSATFADRPDKVALFEQNKTVFESKWGTWKPHQYRDERPLPSFED